MNTFIEKQNMRWINYALIPIFIVVSSLMLLSIEKDSELWLAYLILALVFLPLIWLFHRSELSTEITQKQIRFKFPPLVKPKVYSFDDVESFEFVNYGFVGGWGLRVLTRYGTVYNARGSKGLYVKLKNGRRFLIGTSQPDEMKAFVEALKSKS